jgi:hypothetical protein
MIHSIVGPYTLMKYPPDKKYDPEYRNMRSVIYKGDKIVCMSPGKSVPLDETIPLADYIVEDFVEGIMINAFYDDEWRIATKSNIGANCTFDSTRTFAELFEDCKVSMGLSLDALNPEFSYSFVMQHPSNRIVTAFVKPSLYLIEAYNLEDQTFLDTREIIHLFNENIKCPSILNNFSNTHSDLISSIIFGATTKPSVLFELMAE